MSQSERQKKINIGHHCDLEIDLASSCSDDITVIGHQGNIIVTVPDGYQGSATIIGHRGDIVVRIGSAAMPAPAREQNSAGEESDVCEDKLVDNFGSN